MGAGPSFILSTSIAAVLSSYFTESNFNKIKGLKDKRTTLIGKGQSFIWIEEAACFSIYGPCWTIWEPFNRSWNLVDLFGIIYDPLALGTKLEHYACAGPCLDTSGPFGDPTRPQKNPHHLFGFHSHKTMKKGNSYPFVVHTGQFWISIQSFESLLWILLDHSYRTIFIPMIFFQGLKVLVKLILGHWTIWISFSDTKDVLHYRQWKKYTKKLFLDNSINPGNYSPGIIL